MASPFRKPPRLGTLQSIKLMAEGAARSGRPPRNPHPAGTPAHGHWDRFYRQAWRRLNPQAAPVRQNAGATTARNRQSLANVAGLLCSNPKFQAWLGVSSADEAAAWLRRTCVITSRRELDTDPAAAQRFHEHVRRPFVAASQQ